MMFLQCCPIFSLLLPAASSKCAFGKASSPPEKKLSARGETVVAFVFLFVVLSPRVPCCPRLRKSVHVVFPPLQRKKVQVRDVTRTRNRGENTAKGVKRKRAVVETKEP